MGLTAFNYSEEPLTEQENIAEEADHKDKKNKKRSDYNWTLTENQVSGDLLHKKKKLFSITLFSQVIWYVYKYNAFSTVRVFSFTTSLTDVKFSSNLSSSLSVCFVDWFVMYTSIPVPVPVILPSHNLCMVFALKHICVGHQCIQWQS